MTEDPEALEAATVWIAGGAPIVSLNLSMSLKQPDGEQDEIESWGFLLGDVMHHVSNALAQKSKYPRRYILKTLKDRVIREIENPTHTVTGQFSAEGKVE